MKKTDSPSNKGKLIVDATCAPSDIRYPTDILLLNEARENAESMIDFLYQLCAVFLDKNRGTIGLWPGVIFYHLRKRENRV